MTLVLKAGDDAQPTDELVVLEAASEQLPTLAPESVARARRYAGASRAASTRAKYEAAWDSFARWCRASGHEALPAHPGTVAVFLAAEAARGASPA